MTNRIPFRTVDGEVYGVQSSTIKSNGNNGCQAPSFSANAGSRVSIIVQQKVCVEVAPEERSTFFSPHHNTQIPPRPCITYSTAATLNACLHFTLQQ